MCENIDEINLGGITTEEKVAESLSMFNRNVQISPLSVAYAVIIGIEAKIV